MHNQVFVPPTPDGLTCAMAALVAWPENTRVEVFSQGFLTGYLNALAGGKNPERLLIACHPFARNNLPECLDSLRRLTRRGTRTLWVDRSPAWLEPLHPDLLARYSEEVRNAQECINPLAVPAPADPPYSGSGKPRWIDLVRTSGAQIALAWDKTRRRLRPHCATTATMALLGPVGKGVKMLQYSFQALQHGLNAADAGAVDMYRLMRVLGHPDYRTDIGDILSGVLVRKSLAQSQDLIARFDKEIIPLERQLANEAQIVTTQGGFKLVLVDAREHPERVDLLRAMARLNPQSVLAMQVCSQPEVGLRSREEGVIGDLETLQDWAESCGYPVVYDAISSPVTLSFPNARNWFAKPWSEEVESLIRYLCWVY